MSETRTAEQQNNEGWTKKDQQQEPKLLTQPTGFVWDGESVIPVAQWGRDHWSTLGYIEARAVDHGGWLDNSHMRCNPRLHRQLTPPHMLNGAVSWSDKYGTRLRDGTVLPRHDDWSCVEDMEACGVVETITETEPKRGVAFGGSRVRMRLTDTGQTLAAALRSYKASGGSYSTFGATEDAAGSVVLAVDPSRSTPAVASPLPAATTQGGETSTKCVTCGQPESHEQHWETLREAGVIYHAFTAAAPVEEGREGEAGKPCQKCGGWTANADGHRDDCPNKRATRTCRTPYPGGTCGCGCGCDENRGRPEDGTCTCSECRTGSDDLRRAAEIVRRSARRFPNSGHELSENALADRLDALAAGPREKCGAETRWRRRTVACVLPAGHDGSHQYDTRPLKEVATSRAPHEGPTSGLREDVEEIRALANRVLCAAYNGDDSKEATEEFHRLWDWARESIPLAASSIAPTSDGALREARDDRQRRIMAWVSRTFGVNTAAPHERTARFVEEALELAQACGYERDAADRLTAHVYSKPQGIPIQEAGGVGLTLLALCEAFMFSAEEAEQRELARVEAIPADHFRKRHDAKADAGVALYCDTAASRPVVENTGETR